MNKTGISRRDILKLAGAGAVYSLLLSNVLGKDFSGFSLSKGRGLNSIRFGVALETGNECKQA